MIVFDGYQTAQAKETELAQQVKLLAAQGTKLKIAAIVFEEDAGSVLYTKLKREAAERVGIEYQAFTFSLTGKTDDVLAKLAALNADQSVTGIIIQKPWRRTWETAINVQGEPKDIKQAFKTWWRLLTSRIELNKDVDGLHPDTIAAVQAGTWQEQGRVLPATCQAVLDICDQHQLITPGAKVLIVGKSDLLGTPLYYELLNRKIDVELLDSQLLNNRIENKKFLLDGQVIVSATGRVNLIQGDWLAPAAAVIDVGEPQGDVDRSSLANHVAFLTPVPGGVGPMTVVCLLENAVRLKQV